MPFEFREATSVDGALALLAESGASARPIAGGTELTHRLRSRRDRPEVVVSIGRLSELREIRDEAGALAIGAAVTLSELAASLRVSAIAPALADSALAYRSPQIRNAATLGGVLCSEGRRCEPAVALLALDAAVEVRAAGSARRIAIAEFLRADGARDLRPDELLTRVIVPMQSGVASAYYRVARMGSVDWPLASAAVAIEVVGGGIASARVAVGAALPPQRLPSAEDALRGGPATAVTPEVLMSACGDLPVGPDSRASADYLRRMCAVAIARAVGSAIGGQSTGGGR